MKLEAPPVHKELADPEMFKELFSERSKNFLKQASDRYFYWDEIKHRTDLPFSNPERAWQLLKLSRAFAQQVLEFGEHMFRYHLTPKIQKDLHEFDLKLVGGLIGNPILQHEHNEFLRNNLMEEAIASSQIEGAATTTEVAWDMLKSGRRPRNEGEQMIFNNLRAVRYIEEHATSILTIELIIELHSIMTANTSASECAGGFRRETIYVQDSVDGEIAHIPPSWESVRRLMDDLIKFSMDDESSFIHPVVKASIIHFMIGWIHPFKDGNGRTARALFYWYMIRKGYSLIKSISISRSILESRTQYDKAFLKTEKDENDLNYFISYSLKGLRVAFANLEKYRDRKLAERRAASDIEDQLIIKGINRRQARVIAYLYVREKGWITVKHYAEKSDIVRQTAVKDLRELLAMGLLQETKVGREFRYRIANRDDIARQVQRIGMH